MLTKFNTDDENNEKSDDDVTEALQREDDGRNHDVFDNNSGLNVINIARFL